jgi:hypothetical protein
MYYISSIYSTGRINIPSSPVSAEKSSLRDVIEKAKNKLLGGKNLTEKHCMRNKNDLEGFDETLCDTGLQDKQTPQTVETKEDNSESKSHTDFDRSKIEDYLDFMYANSDFPESVGITKIKKGTKLGETARKIKDYLEYKKILKTDVTKTLILVTRNEANKILF